MKALRKTKKKSYLDITRFLWSLGYGDEICLMFVLEIFGRGLNEKVPNRTLYNDIEIFLKDKYAIARIP